MRILTVCKQVPDSNATIKVAAGGSGIETAGLKQVLNPFDEFGVEQAVRLKESRKDVEEIVALILGGDKAAEPLRTALAMGADRGVHVQNDGEAGLDEIHTAAVLAAAIRREPKPFDLIFIGKQAIDLDSGQVGPALAEMLGIPHVGAAVAFELDAAGRELTARARIEGAEELVHCPLPALVTCEKGLVEPRYPSLPNLMKAKKKPVETIPAANLNVSDSHGAEVRMVKLSPPAARPPCKFIEGDPAEMAAELLRVLREEAKVL